MAAFRFKCSDADTSKQIKTSAMVEWPVSRNMSCGTARWWQDRSCGL